MSLDGCRPATHTHLPRNMATYRQFERRSLPRTLQILVRQSLFVLIIVLIIVSEILVPIFVPACPPLEGSLSFPIRVLIIDKDQDKDPSRGGQAATKINRDQIPISNHLLLPIVAYPVPRNPKQPRTMNQEHPSERLFGSGPISVYSCVPRRSTAKTGPFVV